MIKALTLILFFVVSFAGFAAEPPGKTKAVRGRILVDGAAIYASPDFDSEVIDYLNQGTLVPMSVKQFSGPSGLGLFHKVKTPGGKIGFVTDTDIQPIMRSSKGEEESKDKEKDKEKEREKAERELLRRREERKEKDRRRRDEEEEEANGGASINRKPIFLNKYMGGTVSLVDYSEKFSGHRLHSEVPFLGFRMTGPGMILKGGPPLDLNIAFYPKPPSYLGTFGQGSATGFLALGDLTLFLPFTETKHSILSYGLGLMWTFADYKVTVGGQGYDSEDLRLGLDLDLSYGYRWGKNIVRADAKFYIEKTQYLSEIITYQREY